jgi:hypothetical protein
MTGKKTSPWNTVLGLLAFPLFASVFAPFVITYIASEHGPLHDPDWGLAFGVEFAWIVFLLLVFAVIGMVLNAREKKDEGGTPR